MLEGRDDITVLWDFRIHPDFRRQGVGKTLFDKAIEWSREKNCTMMKIETQNTNINASRFYSSMGSYLGGIKKHQYKEDGIKDEIMFFWYYNL